MNLLNNLRAEREKLKKQFNSNFENYMAGNKKIENSKSEAAKQRYRNEQRHLAIDNRRIEERINELTLLINEGKKEAEILSQVPEKITS